MAHTQKHEIIKNTIGFAGWLEPFISHFAQLTIGMTKSIVNNRINWTWTDKLQ